MTDSKLVDSVQWLYDKAEVLIAEGDPKAAEYLERLLEASDATEHRLFAHKNLGVFLFRNHRVEEACEHFYMAQKLAPHDPNPAYALGHCDAATGEWWAAFFNFIHAYYLGRNTPEELEFLRSAAYAARRIGQSEVAHRMLIGALERSPNNPHILESLGRLYEEQERWIDAIRVRDELIEILKGNDPKARPRQLSPAIENTPIDPSVVQERVRAMNDQLRKGFALVDPSEEREMPDFVLSTTRHPPGLHTLMVCFARREHPVDLLETAQSIWARAKHDRFDVHLSPYVLAAAAHWLSERLLWRKPTTAEKLEALYNVDGEQVRAAVRLLASRFDMKVMDLEGGLAQLGRQAEELQNLFRAILLDADLHELKPSKMLV